MKTSRMLLAVAALCGCLFMAASPAAAGKTADAAMHDGSGKPVGEVTLREMPGGTLIQADFRNLPPGTRARGLPAA